MTLKRKLVPRVCRSKETKSYVISRRDVHGNLERGVKRALVIKRREN